MKRLIFVIIFCIIIVFLVYQFGGMSIFFRPRLDSTSQNTKLQQISSTSMQSNLVVIAANLHIPWDIVFLPSGDLLVTERAGRVLKIGSQTKLIAQIEGVRHVGEGGLLGITLHPNFSKNNYVYLYSTTQSGKDIANRVERYTLANETLVDRKTILDGINGSSNHDGGRILFGPDGYLYITTGDAEKPASAQDKNSLNGKILRVKDDGTIPEDNPFGNAVYSLGHRNPQGLAWDDKGRLWQTEHGPSGLQTGHDEVNLIEKGGNYGWPVLRGDQKQNGYIAPILQSGSSDTWAPAGLTYYNGSLFFSGLRGESIYKARIGQDTKLDLSVHHARVFGRIRTIVVGPDGYFYITTSNTDGRGQKKERDDKIIRIHPSSL